MIEMNTYAILDLLLNLGVKSTIILLCVGLLLTTVKNLNNKLRHRIWTIAIAILLLFPAAFYFAHWNVTFTSPHPSSSYTIEAPYRTYISPDLNTLSADQRPRKDNRIENTTGSIEIFPSSLVPGIVTYVWFFVSILIVLWSVCTTVRWKRRIEKHCRPCPEHMLPVLKSAKKSFQLHSDIRIICSEAVQFPVTYGLRHPVIILPTSVHLWDSDRTSMVILHEMAHIQQKDYALNLLFLLVKAIYWFNPLVWISARFRHLECERLCDEKVINLGINRQHYAHQLLSIARHSLKEPTRYIPAIGFLGKSLLRHRFKSILYPSNSTTRVSLSIPVVVVLLSVVLTAIRFQAISPELTTNNSDLINRIQEETPEIMKLTLHQLVKKNASSTASKILDLLNDHDPSVRATAAWALGQLKYAPALDALSSMVEDQSDEVKEKALYSLAEFGERRTYYHVRPLISDENPGVRKAAIWTLSRIGCLPAFNATCELLTDKEKSIRHLARQLLLNWDRKKLQGWIANYAKRDPFHPMCLGSLDRIVELDQEELLINCLAGYDRNREEALSGIIAIQDNRQRITELGEFLNQL